MVDSSEARQLSRLESLSGELLNPIYRYVVIESNPVVAATLLRKKTPADDWEPSQNKWRSNVPALAATCRRFRHEVLPIYYAENAFTFPTLKYSDQVERAVRAWSRATQAYQHLVTRVGHQFMINTFPSEGVVMAIPCSITAMIPSEQSGLVKFEASSELDHICTCGITRAERNPEVDVTKSPHWRVASALILCQEQSRRYSPSGRLVRMCPDCGKGMRYYIE